MDKEAVKDLMFGGISELIKNKHFYYTSGVGSSYNHWTDEGREALHAYMELMANKILEAEDASLNKRAKELVVKGLKGEKV